MRKLLSALLVAFVLSSSAIAAVSGLTYEIKIDNKTITKEVMGLTGSDFLSVELAKQLALLVPVFASLFAVLCFISLLVLALFIVALFPTHLGRTSYNIERKPGPAFLWGLLMLMLVIPIGALLFFSLIGIAFIPAYIILLAAAFFFGYIAVSQLVGKKVLKSLKLRNKPMMIETAVGLLAFALIGFVPIIGALIQLIAMTVGLGAVFSTRFGVND